MLSKIFSLFDKNRIRTRQPLKEALLPRAASFPSAHRWQPRWYPSGIR